MRTQKGEVLRKDRTQRAAPQFLHQFFERQAVLHPDHPAIEFDGLVMTYAALEARANQIARLLHAHTIAPGALVGLYFKKSCMNFAALLGVLKAGAAYVPIDADTPIQRMEDICQAGSIELILSEGELGRKLVPPASASVLRLDQWSHEVDRQDETPLSDADTGLTVIDPCYVIFTSGSTGKPKGVVVEHRHVVNFVRSLRTVYKLDKRDRIFQGFPLAFDASVEEIWAALSLGGTLVVPDEDVSRSPEDTAKFLTENAVTYFSTVPSFLAMIETELPTVRLLIVGGEDCPSELVSRWAHGRRMLNTYGPTETTIVATYAECLPGVPVNIGKPLPGYTAYVLNDRFQPVSVGEVGELLIGGKSVARGYLGDEPLTNERFVSAVQPGVKPGERLFRTRDLVRRLCNGSLQFVGRTDTLVKIRGFRVDLVEIEGVLMEQCGVRAALATVLQDGSHGIGAFVVPAGDESTIDHVALTQSLRERLPDYMVPRFLDVIEELPMFKNGKADRSQLPPSKRLLTAVQRTTTSPATPIEAVIVESYQACLNTPIYTSDDFFIDLGGHSLLAARIVSDLRPKLSPSRLAIRDLYKHRTVKELAAYLEGIGVSVRSDEDRRNNEALRLARPGTASNWTRCLCAFVQALSVVLFHGIVSAPLALLVVVGEMVREDRLPLGTAVQVLTIAGFFVWPCWLAISIAAKWIVIGRFKAGRYPLWGGYYLRWWFVNLFQSLSWSGMFIGTPLMSLYYRAMGAKIGPNTTICTSWCSAYDVIEIGENTTIGAETHILGYRIENGWLLIDRVSIGGNCFVGTHSNLGLNTSMSDGACLADMSLLADNESISSGQSFGGSPSKPCAEILPNDRLRQTKRPRRRFLFGVLHLGLIYAMGYLLLLSLAPAAAMIWFALSYGGAVYALPAVFAAFPLSGSTYILIVLVVKYLAIGRVRPGRYTLESVPYLRLWFLTYLLDNMRQILIPIYATLLFPLILRLLGAKVGRGVEVSTVMHIIPDLLDLGEGAFLADACMIGTHRIYDGVVELQTNKIGRRTFIGNSAHVPGGVDVGAESLIGVLSVPPCEFGSMNIGMRWLGSPSFELPMLETNNCYSEATTFSPPPLRVCQRLGMEIIRILLPALVVAADLIIFVMSLVVIHDNFPMAATIVLAPCIATVLAFLTVSVAALAKKLLIGTFKPEVKPLWSFYVWANEIVSGLYDSTAAVAMTALLGTPFIAPCLRLMGCKVGKWAFVETTLFSEFDLVHIGDEAALNLGATIQSHLFEDRILKSDFLKIGDRCSVGNMSVVLYGTEMGHGSVLGPLSLLMKGEILPPQTSWIGIPTELVNNIGYVDAPPPLVPSS